METVLFEREAGFANGSLSNAAKMVNPTKIAAVGNELYVADQYDATLYRANYSEAYASLRRIANGEITITPRPYSVKLTDKEFIRDILYIPRYNFNGLLFTDGAFKRYGFDGTLTPCTNYQGLTGFLDFDGSDVYTLDLEPENNPTRWVLRKRMASTSPPLQSISLVASRNLGIASAGASPDRSNYPRGLAIDPDNRCAYVFDRNNAGNFIVYRVGLDAVDQVETIYNGPRPVTISEDALLAPDGSAASFASISCLTYDPVRQTVLIVDVSRGNRIRSMECK